MSVSKQWLFGLNSGHKILFFEEISNGLGGYGSIDNGLKFLLHLRGSISLTSGDKSNSMTSGELLFHTYTMADLSQPQWPLATFGLPQPTSTLLAACPSINTCIDRGASEVAGLQLVHQKGHVIIPGASPKHVNSI